MADLGGRPAFSVGRREFTWHEVWAAARKGPAWKALERQVGVGLSLQRAGKDAPAADVRAEGELFRRERRLHAGEDAEAWLAAREVTLAEWQDHLQRTVLCRLHPERKPGKAATRPLEVTGWCSGAFEEMARDLAVSVLGLDALKPKAAELAAAVERNRLDWIRVDAQVAVFRNDDVAREAIQCVKSDGMKLAAVAKAAKGTFATMSAYLDELDPDVRTRLLPAVAGEALGPVQDEEGSAVYVITDKVLPSMKDRDVVELARQTVVASTVNRALEDQVTWHGPG